MNRIDEKFKLLKEKGKTALIAYIMGGYPNLDLSPKIIQSIIDSGADVLEIGIPYSDPLADGPTIQRASEKALAEGVTTPDVFNLVKNLRERNNIPILIMTYYNIIFHYGLDKFTEDAFNNGVDGVIIPDLPPEEADLWLEASKEKLDTVFLLAPTSTEERIEKIASASKGFIYCVSLTGVTGARESLSNSLPDFIASVKSKTDKPVGIGFGISTSKQAKEISELADGVIIGSAIINLIEKSKTEEEQIKNVSEFIRNVRREM
ncbi:MAG: tryptophan synthase subunit alpha [Actinobacteria bacterium]|nr:tryptophan synthase subunit alpha [Actinomycetota bacterium]